MVGRNEYVKVGGGTLCVGWAQGGLSGYLKKDGKNRLSVDRGLVGVYRGYKVG